MVKRSRPAAFDDVLNFFLVVSGVVVVSALVLMMLRFQRGIFAFVISGMAVILMVYWLLEVRKTIREGPVTIGEGKKARKWNYDLIDANNEVTFLAEVPGPDNEVKIELKAGKLKVTGSRDFMREVDLPGQMEIIGSRCVNGILNVRFRRITSSKAGGGELA